MKNSERRIRNKPGPIKLFCIYAAIGVAFSMFLLAITGAVGGFIYYKKLSAELPDVMTLKDYSPSLITEVFDDDDKLISQFYVEKRILIPFSEIPSLMKNSTIAVEDSSFYTHRGINIKGMLRALIVNIRAGGIVEGGSTITQQLTKTMFLTPERKIKRKLKEIILALRIEQNFGKDEILEIYLNQIYYGHGAYGVEAAAQTYFEKSVKDLSTEEMAMIAGLPKAPTHYSPFSKPEKSRKRRNHVLKRLADENYITRRESNEFSARPLNVGEKKKIDNGAPYFTEYVRQYLENEYGSSQLYRSGLRVYTTLKLEHQRVAEAAIQSGLKTVDRRLGFRGPVGSVAMQGGQVDWLAVEKELKIKKIDTQEEPEPLFEGGVVFGVVTEVQPELLHVETKDGKGRISLRTMDWAHPREHKKDARRVKKLTTLEGVLEIGDIISVKSIQMGEDGVYDLSLEQDPLVQAALVSIEPATGFIRALVGGYDFKKSQFNRAVQARRQPGSAFKPIIYSAALEKGYTPASVFIDSPIIFEGDYKKDWKPGNFEMRFYGPVTLRDALTHSRNVVTVKLLKKIGVPYMVEYADRFSLKTPLTADLSLALGTSVMTPMELTSIYGVFANGGIKATPMAVKYITDRSGKILESNSPVTERIISRENAFITASMMQSVVQEGTGRKARALHRPVAGKTGTTNDFIDAWFLGFTPDLVTGVWVGMDYRESMGINETGSRSASPMWLEYMTAALEGTPVNPFSVPAGIVFKKINKKTGLLATPDSNEDTMFECFMNGQGPITYSAEVEDEKEIEEFSL